MQSATFGLKALGLIVFAAVIAAPFIFQSGCSAREDESVNFETARTQLESRCRGLIQKLAASVQALEPVGIGPWAKRGRLSEVAAAERKRMRSRSLSLLTIQERIGAVDDARSLAESRSQLDRIEEEVDAYARVVEPFRTIWDEDLTQVSTLFQRVRRCNEALGRMIEDQVDVSTVSVPMRNLTRNLEDAVRFWSDSMAERLRPQSEGPELKRTLGLRRIAIGSLGAIEKDLKSLEDPMLRAGLMNDRIRQVVLGTRRRFDRALDTESAPTEVVAKRRRQLEDDLLPRLAPLRRTLIEKGSQPAHQDAVEELISAIVKAGEL